jgi:glutathione S-transferase
MSDQVTLYQLKMSSNNIKVRIALNYKGIPFNRVDVDPQDRSQVVKVSGQPLTPVLVHGDRVIFDSGSILRYLDGNFRNTPPLFSADYDTIKEIERWEQWARTDLVQPFYVAIGQYRMPAEQRDPAETQRASKMLHELTARIEEQLGKSHWLVNDGMSAADVTAAPLVYSGTLTSATAGNDARLKFFAENYHIGEGRERTRAWAAKVMGYDR